MPQYDAVMPKSKITISLPKDQISRSHMVLAQHEKRKPLQELLLDLIEQHGKPPAGDIKWAESALEKRRA
jgi:hypothetical protein